MPIVTIVTINRVPPFAPLAVNVHCYGWLGRHPELLITQNLELDGATAVLSRWRCAAGMGT